MLSMTGCGVAMWYAELGVYHRNNIIAATDNYGEALKQRLKQRFPFWFTFCRAILRQVLLLLYGK
ncbi:hypothetical protein P4S64_12430 [Vibrio sp. M60_M31a]